MDWMSATELATPCCVNAQKGDEIEPWKTLMHDDLQNCVVVQASRRCRHRYGVRPGGCSLYRVR